MIYLLRHGADDDMRLGGWSDAGLSFVGIEQIRRASEKLSSGDYNIQYIFSSDLPRAKESAVIIAEKLGLHVTFIKDFRETNNGDLAGISKEKFQSDYPGLFYSSLEWNQRYPNGESPVMFFTRIKNAWYSLLREAGALSGNTLLVTHGGVIDVILCLENGEAYTNKRVHYHIDCGEIIRAV
ncbi:MAG: histidine phosphatase family protein [Clostridia bacterium]|nr:histidine phosphatase family protein [Clostridia bacterium]